MWLEQAAAAEGVSPEVAVEIFETQCEFHVVYPTLFASLRLNRGKRSALIHAYGEDNYNLIEQYTNGYTLLGLQDRLGVGSCASTVASALAGLGRLQECHAEARQQAARHVPEAVMVKAQRMVDKIRRKVRCFCATCDAPTLNHKLLICEIHHLPLMPTVQSVSKKGAKMSVRRRKTFVITLIRPGIRGRNLQPLKPRRWCSASSNLSKRVWLQQLKINGSRCVLRL